MSELERLSQAAKTLAEVSSASEAWELARTAEAARRYAQLKGLGHEAINYATAIKAKAMVMLADFVDDGQKNGTVAKRGRPKKSSHAEGFSDLGFTDREVSEARRLRGALDGADIDELTKAANAEGEDFGIRGLRRAAAASREPEPVNDPVPPPEGKYHCLVVDPPWPMRNINRGERPDQDESRYPIQSVDDIADEKWVPVRTLADDDCHIYLWVTHRFLPDGIRLLEQWGFGYQCLMTWRKNVGITPYSWMYDAVRVTRLCAAAAGSTVWNSSVATSRSPDVTSPPPKPVTAPALCSRR